MLVGIFFLSMGYHHLIALYIAMAASLHLVVKAKQANPEPQQASPQIAATPERKPKPPAPRRVPSYLRSRGLIREKDSEKSQTLR
jgi:hypothetical protein